LVTADLQHSGKEGAALRSIMPPYLVLHDLLEQETVDRLLEHALAREAAFAPTGVGRSKKDAVKPEIRISVATRDLGPFKPILKSKVLGLVPGLVAQLRTTPLQDPKLELQLVAHNDGAFYRRHIDTQTASDRDGIRVLSGVYYFYAEPRAFTGGALRLYAIGGSRDENFIDIEPVRNSLLVFPSWAPHEVMPVSCPSKRFIASRFAINCWVYRSKH
jgi:Rps23 Pro-64 3,4-dihydroxylase Tpa1-like proline 4-hydroxylase